MKKLLSLIFVSLLLSGSTNAEKLILSCEGPPNENTEFRLYLKENTWTTIADNKINFSFSDEEIFFQSYLFESIVLAFRINRFSGKGLLSHFSYSDEFKDEAREVIPTKLEELRLQYPNNTDSDLFHISLDDFAHSEFKPTSNTKFQCSRLSKKF